MLRIGRSKLHSKWSLTELDTESTSSEDLESASVPHIYPRSSRSKFSVHYSRSALLKAILCVCLLSVMVLIFARPRAGTVAGGKDQLQRTTVQPEHDATSHLLSNVTISTPVGKPLQISSLSNPPRLDRVKLLARLTKLETEFPDDDVNEDTDAIADDLRQVYGLSRWPPLISRVPSFSSHQHEEYTVETADVLFCSTVPCKVLLPVWVRPLSPTQQMAQIQQLMHIAKRLNRTLVLPNTGHASSDTGEMLLGVGTCHRHPFARCFDASSSLLTPVRKEIDRILKPAVPMQPFSEWVKYRPVRPSAQVVVIDSSPSNETHDPFFAMRGAEIRIDVQAERGRGRHKNCLSSRASKLRFGGRSTFVVSPAKEVVMASAKKLDLGQNREIEDERMKANSRYFDGLLAFLDGETMSPDEALCHDTGSSSCPMSNLPLDIGNPDVLVVEWGLGLVDVSSNLSNANAKDEDVLLDYSPRLYALATRVLSSLQRPLILLRSKSSLRLNSKYPPIFADLFNFSSLAKEIDQFVRTLLPVQGDARIVSEGNASPQGGELNASALPDDLEVNATETAANSGSVQKLGTVWLDRGLALGHGNSATGMTEVDPEGTCKPPGLDSPDLADEVFTLDAFLSDDTLKDFSLIDISSALSLSELRNSRRLAGLGKLGIHEDVMTRAILEEIIEKYADRVFSVGKPECVSEDKDSILDR